MSSAGRSVAAWTIGWGIASVGVWTTPAFARFGLGSTAIAIMACVVGAAGMGLGGHRAAAARADTAQESRAPWAEGLAWAVAFALAAAFVVIPPEEEFAKPGDVNAVTIPAGGARNTSGHEVGFSPVQLRFFEAVPLFGAVGGLAAALLGARRSLPRAVLAGLGSAVAWAVAAILGAFVDVELGYILVVGGPRLIRPVSPLVAFLLGSAIAGALAGCLAGVVGESARNPGPSI